VRDPAWGYDLVDSYEKERQLQLRQRQNEENDIFGFFPQDE
jgi:hypothetical protein